MPLLVAHHCIQINTSVLCLTFSSIPFSRWKHLIKCKVLHSSSVLGPLRSDGAWRSRWSMRELMEPEHPEHGQVLLTTQQYTICLCAAAFTYISHFEIVLIYECLCYSYKYLNSIWSALGLQCLVAISPKMHLLITVLEVSSCTVTGNNSCSIK